MAYDLGVSVDALDGLHRLHPAVLASILRDRGDRRDKAARELAEKRATEGQEK